MKFTVDNKTTRHYKTLQDTKRKDNELTRTQIKT